MRYTPTLLVALAFETLALPSSWPVPGESDLYNTYTGKAAPFPGDLTAPILPSAKGSPGPDDILFQNLASAEWIIASFYQQGVEAFNASSFTKLGYPNDTYDRIREIRDNEFGHLNIFQREISDTSIKPGPCVYEYPFDGPEEFLALQVTIEVSSMTFLTGLVQQAATNPSRAALLAVAAVETRHTTWALIEAWNTDPFSGPIDTIYPYPEQILSTTNEWVRKGSCPAQNPPFPRNNQKLPALNINSSLSAETGTPGSEVEFTFAKHQTPEFEAGKDYYVVYFHGLYNVSLPFNTSTRKSTVPAEFDRGKGVILAAIACEIGAPTEDSVLAGPLIMVEQPSVLTTEY